MTEHDDKCPDELTPRERDVFRMIAMGANPKDIAGELEISVKTYDTHRGHIIQKLKLRNNVDIARLAIKLGAVNV